MRSIQQTDAMLLRQAKHGLPARKLRRLQALTSKSEQEIITPAELEEYGQLNQQAERISADRLEALVDLARRREMPVRKLRREIGWRGVRHGA